MVKIKKKILLIVTILLLSLSFICKPVQADSGWDSSYDSGGSWSSGGSWGSGSSHSSGSSWSSSYSSSSGSGDIGDLTFIVIVIIVIIIIVIGSKNNRNGSRGNYNSNNNNNNYNDIDINKIKNIVPELNINEFKQKAFEIYKDIQTSWMNFDTDTIRKLTTDELYNMYSSQLETLKLKKQKNIMKNIELIDAKITEVKEENKVIKINVYLNVRCYDYVIKEANNEVVRGTDKNKINIKYMLTFVKSSVNNQKVEKCPNCGAPVDIISSAKCSYCDSTLVKTSSDYVLSKKVALEQHIER